MVVGADIMSLNGGAWIPDPMHYTYDNVNNTVTVQSKTIVYGSRQPATPDMHYCKVLSPFRAMEWIYVDSLYAKGGLNSSNQ